MNVPSLDHTKSALIILAAGIGAYLVYKGYRAAQDVGDMGIRAYNQLGQTVSNIADNASQGARRGAGAMLDPTGLGQATASQVAAFWNSMGAWDGPFISGDPGYEGWASFPDDFATAAKRMMKPSYAALSQKASRYVQ